MKDNISTERLEKLHPKVKSSFKSFIEESEKTFNTTFRIVQGLRTIQEQDALYNQPWDGKDNDGDGKIDEADEKVTNAKGGSSYHNYGLAIDIVEILNGKANWNFEYKNLKLIAVKYGLDWGGDFKSIVDKPHFQKTLGYSISSLRDKYSKKDFIKGTQYLNL